MLLALLFLLMYLQKFFFCYLLQWWTDKFQVGFCFSNFFSACPGNIPILISSCLPLFPKMVSFLFLLSRISAKAPLIATPVFFPASSSYHTWGWPAPTALRFASQGISNLLGTFGLQYHLSRDSPQTIQKSHILNSKTYLEFCHNTDTNSIKRILQAKTAL